MTKGTLILPWTAAAILFFCYFINISISIINNYNIALISIIFPIILFYLYDKKNISTKTILTAIIAIIAITISYLTNLESSTSYRYLSIIMSVVLGFSIYVWLSTEKTEAIHITLRSVLLATGIYFIVWLVHWFSLEDAYLYDWTRKTPLFRNVRHLGYLLLVSSIVCVWFYIIEKNVKHALIALTIFTISIFLLCWSGSRGAILSTLVGIFILATLSSKKQFFSLTLAIIAGALISLLFPVKDKALGLLPSIARSSESLGSINKLSTGRFTIYQDTMNWIYQKPFFGWGPDAFIALNIKPGFVQTHNGLLQILLEGGIIFSAIIVGIILYVLLCALKLLFKPSHANSNDDDKLLMLGLALTLSLLAHSVFDGIFYHGSPLTFLVFSLALTAATTLKIKLKRQSNDYAIR